MIPLRHIWQAYKYIGYVEVLPPCHTDDCILLFNVVGLWELVLSPHLPLIQLCNNANAIKIKCVSVFASGNLNPKNSSKFPKTFDEEICMLQKYDTSKNCSTYIETTKSRNVWYGHKVVSSNLLS